MRSPAWAPASLASPSCLPPSPTSRSCPWQRPGCAACGSTFAAAGRRRWSTWTPSPAGCTSWPAGTPSCTSTPDLPGLAPILGALPKVSIDHLGLSRDGLPSLLRLVERGAHVKASGFGRGDLDVPSALRELARANPAALVVGTDLPSTRARRPFDDADLNLVVDTLGQDLAAAAMHDNARAFYRS